ncbi:hypothetical protein, partial [Undibacterium sp. 5I1]|uniref:hypothetical protein n=1 Tax=Undibacterium sp. 5I1 TaxID=3048590 RepID=UPI002B234C72
LGINEATLGRWVSAFKARNETGCAIADHMRTDLIQDALTMAMVLRGDRPATVIFHRLNLPNTRRNRSLCSRPRTASPGRWATPGS